MSHLRHTIRLLLKSPGFTVTAVLILGFGIGTNTAMFSLIQTVVVNVLPFPNADRLVHISQPKENDRYLSSISYLDYLDVTVANHTFDTLAISDWDFFDLSGSAIPERVTAIYATPTLFRLTGLPFILGRPFTEDEDKPGGPRVVVLSQSAWKNRFNADPGIIGKNILLSGQSFQVIGVCPRQVEGVSTPSTDTFYVPLHVGFGTSQPQRGDHDQLCIGRLKPGVTLAQAQADLEVIQNNLAECYPDAEKGYGIRVESFSEVTVSDYAITIWLLGAAVGCLLLISISNVANLLFARALDRRKEMNIRSTLGASRIRLILQLLVETTFLAAIGGLAGLGIAWIAIELIKKVSPEDFRRFQDVQLDTNAFIFILGVTVLVAILAGLFPALSVSHSDPGSALKDESGRAGTAGRQRQRAQSLLVASQVALACLSLIGAGLLMRSFFAAFYLPLGFNAEHLVSANISPTTPKYTNDPVQLLALWDQVLQKARTLPGVIDAAMNSEQPYEWTFGDPTVPFRVMGQPEVEPGKEPVMCGQAISPGYFRSMQIPLLQGRDFDVDDGASSQPVAIVDAGFARKYFPNENPIGKQIIDLWGGSRQMGHKIWTIVGVVQSSRHNRPQNPSPPYQAYFPDHQVQGLFREFLLLRTAGDSSALIPQVRKLVASIDPEVPVTPIVTFDDLMAKKFAPQRLGVLLGTLFSVVALLLSAVGLYGLLTYYVNQRRREIGVRIALGAPAANILNLVVRRGIKLVTAGLLVGVVLALVLTRLVGNILYGVAEYDPITLAAAATILGLVAIFACILPALRAAKTNPTTVLRE
ncbi:MAG TPA: ABC transporter permease [Chthoniobacterales bacterium]